MYGADVDVYDADLKTPVIYAVEECQFEVLEIIRDYIFLNKYGRKKCPRNQALKQQSKLLKDSALEDEMLTPNKIHYNYDTTSPYYIKITHRRHRPQPLFPPIKNIQADNIFAVDETKKTHQINIFSLTRENINELAQNNIFSQKSRKSIVETWLRKSQRPLVPNLSFDNIEKTEFKKDMDKEQLLKKKISSDSECCVTLPFVTDHHNTKKKVYFEIRSEEKLKTTETESSYSTIKKKIQSSEESDNQNHKGDNAKHSLQHSNWVMHATEGYRHTDDENGLVYQTNLLSSIGHKVEPERENLK